MTELREQIWAQFLMERIKREGKGLENARKEPKSTEWNDRVARALHAQTTATNIWIADRLAMGHPSRARNLIKEKL